jgi:integrase
VSQAFERVCRKAGIKGLRFHDLRHEATSRLFEKGLNTMEAAAVTGHKTLVMLKRYTHLRAEDLAEKLG